MSLFSAANRSALRQRRLSRGTWLFIVSCSFLYVCAECAAYTATRFSEFYRRIRAESQAAQKLRRATPGSPRTILLAGNSLLKYGVDFTQLNRELAGRAQASRLVMEGSAFYDWYYGLQTLFDRGMRPDEIILCLNAGFLADPTFPDPLSAYLLFDIPTIGQISRDLHLGANATSGLYAGHLSALFGAGPELRGVLLGRLVKSPDLWDSLLPPILPFANDPGFTEVAALRLGRIRQLCELNGTRFVFLIPPMRERGDQEILRAGKLSSTEVLRPVPNFTLSSAYYRDNYHLNQKGAVIFTSALLRSLDHLGFFGVDRSQGRP